MRFLSFNLLAFLIAGLNVTQAHPPVADPRWMEMEDCYGQAYTVAHDLARLSISMPKEYSIAEIPHHQRLEDVRVRCATYRDEVELAVEEAIVQHQRERAELAARNRQYLETYNPAALSPSSPTRPEPREPVCRPGSCR